MARKKHNGNRCLTGLLNMSLLAAAATPVGTVVFARQAFTPSTVNGSGTTTEDVSVSPLTSISTAAGGLMLGRRYVLIMSDIRFRNSQQYD